MEPSVEPSVEPPDPAADPGGSEISRYVPRNLVRRASFLEGDDGNLHDVHEYEVQSGVSPEFSRIHSSEFDSEADSNCDYVKPKLILGANFISGRRNSVPTGIHDKRSARIVHLFLRNPLVRNGMGILTLVDAVLTCVDIDARAGGTGGDPPIWLTVASNCCLSMYSIEFLMWVWVLPLRRALRDKFLMIDLFIITIGYVELILLAAGWNVGTFGFLRVLRIVRIMRLLKVFRKIPYLKELQKLVNMTSTCMKTLGWSFIFCFVIMTIWAMLMVEFVHPLILELHESEDLFAGDEQILRAASTVMHANLLLFKTVIAGDSWGRIAVPLIEAYPATGIIFVGSLLTLVFGVLQLIVAVVVDTFAEKRERDVLNRAEEMENDIEEDKRFLQRIFDRVDEDGSGELTLEELIEGAKNDPEFQSRLRVMDIDESDLQQLFMMIGVKGTGQVSPEEFIQPLSRWVHESKTANRFVKYNVMRTMHQNDELRAFTSAKFDALNLQIQRIASSLGLSMETPTLSRRNSRRQRKTSKSNSSDGTEPKDSRRKGERGTSDASSVPTCSAKQLSRSGSKSELTMTRINSSTDSKSNTTIAERLEQMETQQRLILDNLTLGQPPEASRPQTSPMPWDSMQLGDHNLSQSMTLSSFSGRSGGVPGGTVARPGSPSSLPMSSANNNSRSDSTQEKELSIPPHMLSRKDLILHEDQLQESAGCVSDRELDAALQSAMQVMEDLLQNAATQACVKAAATLRVRLQTLLSRQGESRDSEAEEAPPKTPPEAEGRVMAWCSSRTHRTWLQAQG